MDYQHGLDFVLFFLIMGYITLFIKESRSGWNIVTKCILYTATAETAIISGIFIGFYTVLAYIIFSLVAVVVGLPILRTSIERRRRRYRRYAKRSP